MLTQDMIDNHVTQPYDQCISHVTMKVEPKELYDLAMSFSVIRASPAAVDRIVHVALANGNQIKRVTELLVLITTPKKILHVLIDFDQSDIIVTPIKE